MTVPYESLEELFSRLGSLGAESLADDIRRAIARGTLGQVEVRPRKFEVTQQPFSAEAAYQLAAGMVLASIEPVLIHRDLTREYAPNDQEHVELSWKRDLIEGSPAEPRTDLEIAFPESTEDEIDELRKSASALACLLDEIDNKGE